MKISLEWLSDFLDVAPIRADLRGVLGKLTMRGLEVEAIHDLSAGFEKVIVAQIETRDKHPNADRLSICKVNTGAETLQIVCGAQNMKAGDKIALSMIGAHLPNGLKIEKGKIRDVESFGMLCSEVELGIAEKSEGILILPKDAPVGKPLAPYLGRNDILFEINVTPNRGDALSHLGVARELASILGQKLKTPQLKLTEAKSASSEKIKVTLHNPSDAPDLCLQYHGKYIEGVRIAPSPEWMQRRLQAVGLRPINNVVDVTNYVLMELGQPLHAFDYAQVHGSQINVRRAKKGEKIPLLDGTSVELHEADLVIADSERPVALAGVMGGANSEVTERTVNLLLEAAQFAPSTVRRSSRRHQKHSDSSHRFERQVDARGVTVAMNRAAALIAEVAGGKPFQSAVSQYSPGGEKIAKGELKTVRVSVDGVNRALGTQLSEKEIHDCLLQASFSTERTAKNPNEAILVHVPSFRPDVTLPEDVNEEVIRVWGYDRVESKVPRLEFIPESTNAADLRARNIDKIKIALAENGFCEAVNFAFTSKTSNARWGGAESKLAVSLANPLNEEFSTLKTSLLSGLLENLLNTSRHQEDDIRLFEVRPVFLRDEKSETGVREEWRVALICCGRAYVHALTSRDRAIDFFDVKGFLEFALESLGSRGLRYQASTESDDRFHPAQRATLALGRGPCGVLARLHPRVDIEFKLRQPVFYAEFSLDRALEVVKTDRKFSPIAKFPKVERDFSFLTPKDLPAEKVLQSLQKAGKPLVQSVSVVDIYSGDKVPADKLSLSVSVVLSDPTRTLEDAEIDAVTQRFLGALDKELGVKLRLQ